MSFSVQNVAVSFQIISSVSGTDPPQRFFIPRVRYHSLIKQ